MGALASIFRRPAEEPLFPVAGIVDFEGRNGALFAKGPTGEVQFTIKGCNWVRYDPLNQAHAPGALHSVTRVTGRYRFSTLTGISAGLA